MDDDESTLPPSLPPPSSLLHPFLPRDPERLRRPGDLEADALGDADFFGMLLPTRNLRQHFLLVEHHAPRTPTASGCSFEAAPDALGRRITGSRTTEHTGGL